MASSNISLTSRELRQVVDTLLGTDPHELGAVIKAAELEQFLAHVDACVLAVRGRTTKPGSDQRMGLSPVFDVSTLVSSILQFVDAAALTKVGCLNSKWCTWAESEHLWESLANVRWRQCRQALAGSDLECINIRSYYLHRSHLERVNMAPEKGAPRRWCSGIADASGRYNISVSDYVLLVELSFSGLPVDARHGSDVQKTFLHAVCNLEVDSQTRMMARIPTSQAAFTPLRIPANLHPSNQKPFEASLSVTAIRLRDNKWIPLCSEDKGPLCELDVEEGIYGDSWRVRGFGDYKFPVAATSVFHQALFSPEFDLTGLAWQQHPDNPGSPPEILSGCMGVELAYWASDACTNRELTVDEVLQLWNALVQQGYTEDMKQSVWSDCSGEEDEDT